APDQPVDTELGPGVAVRVTAVPAGYFPANGPGAGAAVMDPSPIGVSTSAYCAVKVAVTFLGALIGTVQVATVPEHAPDQPVNTELGPGVAVRVTAVPAGYFPASGPGAGTAAMEPSPTIVSASAYCAVKVAVTLLAASIVTLQVATVPEHAPDQLVNAELDPGVAVRVTSVPAGYFPASGPGSGTAAMEPSPIGVSTSAYCAVKVAVTLVAASIV